MSKEAVGHHDGLVISVPWLGSGPIVRGPLALRVYFTSVYAVMVGSRERDPVSEKSKNVLIIYMLDLSVSLNVREAN
ncbi:hypothetical protein SAMD00023353_21600010 [Rosellinia necatrix]|uniref:Uncharacterized protein n=1 Tax=Rosellinia necatrix TaxID=77044 RepID=A0A1S8ABK8_ROSNE|nr:hypothetical protein SAMD00023353_6400340 [Rosellinia necatrix]GAW27429.1 hypothetical protein SAMD00023353_21600010 [Rosellinia necatrix]